jgi:hypothetical protein
MLLSFLSAGKFNRYRRKGMPFLKDVIVAESMEMKTKPKDLFNYLTGIVDDESFKTLNLNNVNFRWLKGRPKNICPHFKMFWS